MKKLLITIVALIAAQSAFAQNAASGISSLPKLSGSFLEFHAGHQSNPHIRVAPAVVLNVKFRSCSRQTLFTTVKKAKDVTYVRVHVRLGRDCHGPKVARNYPLNLGYYARNVVVLNPIDIAVKQRM